MLTEQYKTSIDYAKAIGIIFVVIGHYPNNIINPYYFHMPLFFFIGGVLFNEKSTISKVIHNTLKRHWFFLFSVYVLTALSLYFISLFFDIELRKPFGNGVIDTLNIILSHNFHNNPFFLVAWFLLSYSLVYILYSIVYKVFSIINLTPHFICFILFLILGYIGIEQTSQIYIKNKIFYFNILTQVFVGLSFYATGVALKKIIFKINSLTSISIILSLLLLTHNYGYLIPIGMSWSNYNGGYISVMLSAYLGILLVFNVSNIASFFNDKKISVVGKNSKSVMCYHLLIFTLLDCIFNFFGVFELNKNNISIHYQSDFSFAIYVFCGVYFSILLGNSITKLTRGYI